MFEQVFHPWQEWEDYRAGMWRAVAVTAKAEAACRVLGDPDVFYNAACDMLRDWPKAAEHNLTNTDQNRRAWIGQATCCYLTGASEQDTRNAWWLLLLDERDAANAVADRVIAEWEAERAAHVRPMLFAVEDLSA